MEEVESVAVSQVRVCTMCKTEKSLECFSPRRGHRTGRQPTCRKCTADRKRARYAANPAPARQEALARYVAKKGTPEGEAARERKRRYDREYGAKNADLILSRVGAWAAANGDKVRAIKRSYQKRNPHLTAARQMLRKAAKANATPKWLSEAQIEEMRMIYLDAATRPGGPWQVDHIIPLRGKNICGLHVPWNLQVILATENQKKGNRWTEEMASFHYHRRFGPQGRDMVTPEMLAA